MFIGRNLNKPELIEGVKACQVKGEPLRFKVGDPVFANIDSEETSDEEGAEQETDADHDQDSELEAAEEIEKDESAEPDQEEEQDVKEEDEEHWVPGHIVMHWDQGNPYRILLDNGDTKQGTMVWSPMDVDDFVRINPDGEQMENKRVQDILRLYDLSENPQKRKLPKIDDGHHHHHHHHDAETTQSPRKRRKVDSST